MTPPTDAVLEVPLPAAFREQLQLVATFTGVSVEELVRSVVIAWYVREGGPYTQSVVSS